MSTQRLKGGCGEMIEVAEMEKISNLTGSQWFEGCVCVCGGGYVHVCYNLPWNPQILHIKWSNIFIKGLSKNYGKNLQRLAFK